VAEQFVEFLCKNRLHWGAIVAIMVMSALFLQHPYRTRQQYTSLLEQAGFAFVRVIDMGADVAILEAAPV
jgi:hypothetical protein